MVNIPLFAGFHTCQVVQNFFHQQYHEQGNYQEQIQFPCFPTQSVTRRSVMNVLHSLLTKPCNLKSNLRCKSQKQKQKRENVDTNINFRPTAAVFSSPFNQSSNISTIQRTPLQSLEMSNPCLSRKRPLETSPPGVSTSSPPRKPPRHTPDIYPETQRVAAVFFWWQVAHHGLLHLPAALDFSGVTKMAMFAVCTLVQKIWGFHGFLENVGPPLKKKRKLQRMVFWKCDHPGKSWKNVN